MLLKQLQIKSLLRKVVQSGLTALLAITIVFGFSLATNTTERANAQADFCTGLSDEFAGFFDCSTNFNSFTNFQGGLEQPDVDGYDESLTQSTDIKTYAKNIANFALGFLGLIAVLIIIYSGFLYVTSRGEADQMESGKKGITYALIGILIIFSSYALVNTILQAPGGDGTNINQGGLRASSGRSVGSSNFNSMAKEVQVITTNVLTEYQQTQAIYERLLNLTTYTPDVIVSRQDFISYLEFIRTTLTNIRNTTDVTSNMRSSIDATITLVVNPGIQSIQDRVVQENYDAFQDTVLENNSVDFFQGIGSDLRNFAVNLFGKKDGDGRNGNLRTIFECNLPAEERSVDVDVRNCEQTDQIREASNLGTQIDAAFDNLIKDQVIVALQKDFDLAMAVNKNKLERQKLLIQNQNTVSGSYTDFIAEFTGAIAKLDDSGLKGSALFKSNPSRPGISDLAGGAQIDSNINMFRELIVQLQSLYNKLNQAQFTTPVIIASSTRGSAPFVVTFDASESYSPDNQSVSSYQWDIDGDGSVDGGNPSAEIECLGNNFTSSSITCIYSTPGSYTPSLVVSSTPTSGTTEDTLILPGIAYIPLSVTAPVARIDLTAKVAESGTTSVLRKYDDRGNIAIDINEYSVTLEDAKKGITFDASGTDTAAGANTITKYQWNFTDSTVQVVGSGLTEAQTGTEVSASDGDVVAGANAETITRKFNKRGLISATLAVTDTQGNIDRKIFNIKVTDLVARITTRNNSRSGVPNQEFIFDGSSSRSDVTPELTYAWQVLDSAGTVISTEAASNDDSEFRYRFTNPGDYTVKLSVEAASRTSEDSIPIRIESVAPVANLEAIFADVQNQPNLVIFDASASFRPDATAEAEANGLTYSWRIKDAVEDIDYEILTDGVTINRSSSAQIPTNTFGAADKIEVLFKRKGNFDIDVTTKEPLGKTAAAVKKVTIASIIDLKFSDDQLFAAQLSTGSNPRASIDLKLQSKNADRAQINFGDNSPPKDVTFTAGAANVVHEYTRAGTFEVTIKASKGTDSNIAKALIVVGNTEAPIAIPKLRIGSAVITNLASLPPIYRGTVLSFDARSSINVNGTNQNLNYEWNFGDGRFNVTEVVNNFAYNDLPPTDPGYFTVTLTVTDKTNPALTSSQSFNVPVVAAKPTLQSLVARPQLNREQTPLNVTVEAIGATDKDGRIVNYRFYYFPLSDPTRQLGVKNVSVNSTTLTVNTFGEQNQEVEYGFCVDLTDNDGNEALCNDLFTDSNYVKQTIKNGKNDPPKASFTVDRTNIKVGETVNFTSTSRDEDGQIIEWTYDIEGDNSFTNDKTWEQGTVSQTYTKKSEEGGYKVRLRVLDDKGATAVSSVVTIFVDGILDEPVAAFTDVSQDKTVTFRDRSKADDDNNGKIVKWEWDFDNSLDTDGDSDPKNDIDSTVQNPKFTYSRSGAYKASLMVTDSEGNEATVVRNIVVQEVDPNVRNPYANSVSSTDESTTATDGVNPYRDLIRSVPTKNQETGIITLAGEKAELKLNFNHLPTSSRRILIDRNIYCDADGDGVRNNDIDIEQTFTGREIVIEYLRSEMSTCDRVNRGVTDSPSSEMPIRIQVAVEANDGTIYTDQADIIFQGSSLLQASLRFDPMGNVPAFIYIGSLLLILLGSSVLVSKKEVRKNRKLKI